MATQVVDQFMAFVISERERYDGDDNNRVAFSLGQVGRYLRFVEIARSRYRTVNKEVTDQFRRRMEEVRTNSGMKKLSPEEIADYEKGVQLHELMHFEIESFFLFAKILLDKAAHFIEDYFGKVRGVSLRSHDKWCKAFEQYSTSKGFVIPSGMKETMNRLRSLVANYRDKYIVHLQNPRAIRGTHLSREGGTKIGISTLYPNNRDESTTSPSVEEVCTLVETYVQQLVSLVSANRNKTRYQLQKSN